MRLLCAFAQVVKSIYDTFFSIVTEYTAKEDDHSTKEVDIKQQIIKQIQFEFGAKSLEHVWIPKKVRINSLLTTFDQKFIQIFSFQTSISAINIWDNAHIVSLLINKRHLFTFFTLSYLLNVCCWTIFTLLNKIGFCYRKTPSVWCCCYCFEFDVAYSFGCLYSFKWSNTQHGVPSQQQTMNEVKIAFS